MKRVIVVSHLILFFCISTCLSAQDTSIHRDTLYANIKFRQGYSQVDSAFSDNQMHLERLITLLDSTALHSSSVLKSITIKGSASPEGYTPMNRKLSEKRARNMQAYIVNHTPLKDLNVKTAPSDVDWELLSEMIAGTDQPWRDEAMRIIANTPIWVFKDKKIVDGRKKQLCMLQGGRAWEYMSKNFFPTLRNARFRIMCEWETEERFADTGKDSATTLPVPIADTVFTESVVPPAKIKIEKRKQI